MRNVSGESSQEFAIHVAAEAYRVKREQIERDLKHGRFPAARRGGPAAGWMRSRAATWRPPGTSSTHGGGDAETPGSGTSGGSKGVSRWAGPVFRNGP